MGRLHSLFMTISLLSAAVPAGAVSYTSYSATGAPLQDPGKLTAETTFFTFDSAPAAGFSIDASSNYVIAQGSFKDHAAPAGDSTSYLYFSPKIPDGIATLSFIDLSVVSFYWGSIDKYNAVDVLGADGVTLTTISGADISPANGGRDGADTNKRVFIKAGAGEVISGLRFRATGIAFEIDDVAGRLVSDGSGSPTPEPATWALMVVGFGMVGGGARHRRSVVTRISG